MPSMFNWGWIFWMQINSNVSLCKINVTYFGIPRVDEYVG
jgi:hypothetical protein